MHRGQRSVGGRGCSCGRRGHAGLRDDTTVVVVDLNPSGLPMTIAPITCDDFGLGDCCCCCCCTTSVAATLWRLVSPLLVAIGLDPLGERECGPLPLAEVPEVTSDPGSGTELTSVAMSDGQAEPEADGQRLLR